MDGFVFWWIFEQMQESEAKNAALESTYYKAAHHISHTLFVLLVFSKEKMWRPKLLTKRTPDKSHQPNVFSVVFARLQTL